MLENDGKTCHTTGHKVLREDEETESGGCHRASQDNQNVR